MSRTDLFADTIRRIIGYAFAATILAFALGLITGAIIYHVIV